MKTRTLIASFASVATGLALAASAIAAPTQSVAYGDTSVKLDPEVSPRIIVHARSAK
jgi:hypothetical protein